jgi:hypothetical protein
MSVTAYAQLRGEYRIAFGKYVVLYFTRAEQGSAHSSSRLQANDGGEFFIAEVISCHYVT